MAEVDVFDHADLLELRERAVDGGDVDVGMPCRQFLRRDPVTPAVEVFEQCPAGLRQAAAASERTRSNASSNATAMGSA